MDLGIPLGSLASSNLEGWFSPEVKSEELQFVSGFDQTSEWSQLATDNYCIELMRQTQIYSAFWDPWTKQFVNVDDLPRPCKENNPVQNLWWFYNVDCLQYVYDEGWKSSNYLCRQVSNAYQGSNSLRLGSWWQCTCRPWRKRTTRWGSRGIRSVKNMLDAK